MIIQSHEGYEDSKSYLLGPHFLLWLSVFQRRLLPRMSLRKVLQSAGFGMEFARVPELPSAPLRYCTHLNELGTSHTAGTAGYASVQFCLHQFSVGVEFARSVVRYQQRCVRVIESYAYHVGRARRWKISIHSPIVNRCWFGQ